MIENQPMLLQYDEWWILQVWIFENNSLSLNVDRNRMRAVGQHCRHLLGPSVLWRLLSSCWEFSQWSWSGSYVQSLPWQCSVNKHSCVVNNECGNGLFSYFIYSFIRFTQHLCTAYRLYCQRFLVISRMYSSCRTSDIYIGTDLLLMRFHLRLM